MSDRAPSSAPVLRVAVIGGGTAGLATALRLKENIPASSLELSIFEASDVLGGNNQSFEGVPLFFSCFRSSGSKVMMEYMKKLGVRATCCRFTDLSLKDRSVGKQSNAMVDDVSPKTSAPLTESAKRNQKTKEFSSTHDESDNSSEASSVSTAASKSASIECKESSMEAVSEYRPSAFDSVVADVFCSAQEHLSTSKFSSMIFPSSTITENLLWSSLCSNPKQYKMHEIAAGINYFYSSRDQGFNEKHVREYYHLNCGTYYWSIENEQNNLMIERVRDRLLGASGEIQESTCLKKESVYPLWCASGNSLGVDGEHEHVEGSAPPMHSTEHPKNEAESNVKIHCGTFCSSVEPLLDGTVRLQYGQRSRSSAESDSESSSGNGRSQAGDSEDLETAIFDHVIVCVHPHVAETLVKKCKPLQSLFTDYPFRPVYANAIVHTDQSVKCSRGPTALTYEVGPDSSWILHIDCEKYYGMEKGKGNGNIVSIFYAPDTCDSVDPNLVKGRFSATLSKSKAHDQGSEQDVDRALRERLTQYHQQAESNVYLCGSYYCYEQWSQDAWTMAVEVADCVVDKFRQGTHLNVRAKGNTRMSL